MKKLIILIIIALIASSCMSIRYPWKSKKQEVLYEFIEYLYENRNSSKFDNLDRFPMIKIDFLNGGYMSKYNFKAMFNEYPDGIALCNIQRDIVTYKNDKRKKISLHYKVINERDRYLSFLFYSNLAEEEYYLTFYNSRLAISCKLRDIYRPYTLPEY